jgi:predicted transcriptional regulator
VGEGSQPTSLAKIMTKIVAAYVSNNQIATADLAGLITAVAGQLGKAGAEPEQATEEKPEPAVSVRRSLRPDHLICLVCGQQRKTLRRHLAVRHDLSPAEYRERFGLKPDYPMMAPNYTQQRREVALATGLGRAKESKQQGRKGRRMSERGERRGDDVRA